MLSTTAVRRQGFGEAVAPVEQTGPDQPKLEITLSFRCGQLGDSGRLNYSVTQSMTSVVVHRQSSVADFVVGMARFDDVTNFSQFRDQMDAGNDN